MIEEMRRLFAVLDDMDRSLDSRSFNRFPDQENVCRIIFDHQNMRITRRRALMEGW